MHDEKTSGPTLGDLLKEKMNEQRETETSLPENILNLRNLLVRFPGHEPSSISKKLVAVADQVDEHVITMRQACDKLFQELNVPRHVSSTFISQFCNMNRTPDREVLARAVGAAVDGSLSFDMLIDVIEVEYGFTGTIAGLWATCLVKYEFLARENKAEAAARSRAEERKQGRVTRA